MKSSRSPRARIPNPKAHAAETRRRTANTSRARVTGAAYQDRAGTRRDGRRSGRATACYARYHGRDDRARSPPPPTSSSSARTTGGVSRRPPGPLAFPRAVATTDAPVTIPTAQSRARSPEATRLRSGSRTCQATLHEGSRARRRRRGPRATSRPREQRLGPGPARAEPPDRCGAAIARGPQLDRSRRARRPAPGDRAEDPARTGSSREGWIGLGPREPGRRGQPQEEGDPHVPAHPCPRTGQHGAEEPRAERPQGEHRGERLARPAAEAGGRERHGSTSEMASAAASVGGVHAPP